MCSELEIWKDTKGYDGLYQVGNFGRVKSLERICNKGKGNYNRKEKIRKLLIQKRVNCKTDYLCDRNSKGLQRQNPQLSRAHLEIRK